MGKESRGSLAMLADAVMKMIETVLRDAPFDKTDIGIVTRVNGDGTYVVNAFGGKYTIAYSGSLKNYQAVRVKAPQNNFSKLYIEGLG